MWSKCYSSARWMIFDAGDTEEKSSTGGTIRSLSTIERLQSQPQQTHGTSGVFCFAMNNIRASIILHGATEWLDQ